MISNESEGVRGQASIDFFNSKIRDGKHEFAYKLHRSKVRLNELLLLIDGQPRNGPYFAAFYYRQIEDLRIASMGVRARLEGYLQRFEMENTQTRNNLKMIQALEIPNSDLLWRKNWIKTNYDSIIASQARWIEQIEDLLKQTVEFQAQLNEIMAAAEHNLIANYEGYFSYRFDFLGNTYGRSGLSFQWYELSRSMNGWVVALPTQLLVILPDKHWWPNLAGLALVTLLLAAITASLVARYRWFTLAKYLRPYIYGWLGIYFALGIIILPSTSKDLFFSLAMLFFALAIMDSAWKARNDDKTDPRGNPLLFTIFSLALIDLMTDLLAPIRVVLAAIMVLGIMNIIWFVLCYKFPGSRPKQDIPSILLTGGLVWSGAGIAAWMGYLYPAMLIAVFGGLTLCVLYAGTVFTRFLLLVSNTLTSGRRSWASFISTLVIPFLWLGLFIGAIHWAASVFNANWFFLHIYDIDLVPAVSIEISLRKMLVLLLIGLLVRFTLSWLGEMLAVISDSRQLDLVSINSTFLVIRYVVWILFILFVLASLHIEWDNLKWILGGLSVGFGFALKDILENFFSGIIVLIGKQVRPGDTIEFGTVYGKVDKINVRATFIKTEDNALIAIPNTQIVSKEFRNWTLNGDIRRNQFEVGVAYGSDIQFVIETMLEIMNASNLVLKVIPPDVLFIDFASSAILLRARYWVHVGSRSISASLLRRRMEEVFRERGIVIAFPQLDVHIDNAAARPSLLPV
jgi:small-conductance mechanosensitive channel